MEVFAYKLLCSFFFFYILFSFKDSYTLTHTHTHKCRYTSIQDPLGNDTAMAFCDSKDLIYQAKDEGEEDCKVPGELSRLLQQEERTIQPHKEPVDTINLGTEENKKEVKVGANLEPSVKEHLIQLWHDYVEIFAWSYEYMPGLDTDIVVHRLPTREDCPLVKQKFCRMRLDMSEKIKAEVMKQYKRCLRLVLRRKSEDSWDA